MEIAQSISRHEIKHSALIFGGIVEVNMLQITFTIFKLKSHTIWQKIENMSQREIITFAHSTKLRKKKRWSIAEYDFILNQIYWWELLNRSCLILQGKTLI